MDLPTNISVLELVWEIVSIVGMGFALRLVLRGRRWKRTICEENLDDPRVEVADGLVFRGSVKVVIFLAALLAGLDAMDRPQISSGSSVSGAVAVILMCLLTVVLVVYDEIMHHRIVNALDRMDGLPLTMPISQERFK